MHGKDKKVIILNEVESTNNYANQLILSGAEDGTVVLAQFQKRGKGQQGNFWESQAGKNLLASIIIYPRFLDAANQFLLSKVVSLAIVQFLNQEAYDVSIKWPNDIYVKDKKIAGILIENSIKGSVLHSAVIGIGLNLNQELFLSDAPNPVSLKQLTNKEYSIDNALSGLLTLFYEWYDKLRSGMLHEINSSYMSNLFRRNVWALFKKNGNIFEARITGIGEFGQLQLETRDGKMSEYMFKEVEYVL